MGLETGTRRGPIWHSWLVVLGLLLATALSACSGSEETSTPTTAPATRAPTAAPTEPPASATPVPAAPTQAPTEAPPTEAPPATAEAQQKTTEVRLGSAVIRDNFAFSDQLFVRLQNLAPLEPGKVYAGWLLGYEGVLRWPIGKIPVDAEGTAQFAVDAPDRANLLTDYDGFLITIEPEEIPDIPSGSVVSWGQVSLNSMEHIRHLLVKYPDTPGQIGLAVGLRQQTLEVLRHAQYIRDALGSGDLSGVKRHTEHVILMIEGSKGSNYRDLDGDGQVLDPGDGFGLLSAEGQPGYLESVAQKAKQAGEAAFATEVTKVHSQHVQDAAANVETWLTEVRDIGLTIFAENDLEAVGGKVQQMVALAERALNGFDANTNEVIEPIPGEAGAKIAYQHSQFLAEMPLVTQQVEMVFPAMPPAPTPTPLPSPTPTPTLPPPAADAFSVGMANSAFGPQTITIKVGTTVTFVNQDTAPHTATGDNQEFNTGILRSGESAEVTFNKAGTFNYYCEFHGGPGGQGMSGTIIVEP